MKAPNGYGTVIKLKGNRRRPYVIRKTEGWKSGKRIIKAVGYYETREEAMIALAEYNKSPYDMDARKITTAELYGKWLKSSHGLAPRSVDNVSIGFKNCKQLHNVPYHTIRTHHMQACVDGCAAASTKGRVKVLFGHLDNLGYGLDVIHKKYSEGVRVGGWIRQKKKIIFTAEEVNKLWENIDAPWVDTVLILLYSGWRIQELLNLRVSDIDLETEIMTGGVKTKSGKDRIVPIHSRILPLVKKRLEAGHEHFLSVNGKKMIYQVYRCRFHEVMELIETKHTIHETRHTFRTWLNRAKADLACANKIMGHVCKDVGLEIYTHNIIEELRATIELIKSEHY